MPCARYSGTAQMPDASLRFEDGQCATVVPRAARSARSSASAWMTWARTTCAPGDSGVVEVAHVPAARALRDEGDLVEVLRGVGVDDESVGPRPLPDLAQETVRAGDGEARAERDAQAAAAPPVPGLREAGRLVEGRARLPVEAGRVRRRIVHEGVAARHAHARRRRRPEDRVRVVRGRHVEDRRRAAREELGEAESRRDLQRRVVVGGLARPDVRREPGEEGQVVRAVAQERLAQVDVRLDEPGQEPHPGRVETREGPAGGRVGAGARLRLGVARRDRAVLDEQRAARHDVAGARHADREGVLDEKGCHGQPAIIQRRTAQTSRAPSWTSSQRLRGRPPP